jgi:formamidopyrimidine-DNA glycosylase
MDQSIIAGIGNIYSDEILFQAGVRPNRKMVSLTEEEKGKIFLETKKTLRKAVEVNADFNQLKGSLLLFREKGANCPRCGGILKTLKMNNRTAYYCPKCQH